MSDADEYLAEVERNAEKRLRYQQWWDGEHQPFDAQRRCPKCSADALVEWDDGSKYLFAWDPPCVRRTCTRCAFKWGEVPLDRVSESTEEDV